MPRTILDRGIAAKGCFQIGISSFFLLLVSAVPLTFDGVIVWDAWRQIHALGYSTVAGAITCSKVEEHSDEDGTTYRSDLKYTYRVGDRKYEGNQYRYGQWFSADRSALRIAAECPVGKAVDVFHDPGNPADAVLTVGLQGTDLFRAMCLLPFNLVIVGLWIRVWGASIRRTFGVPAGGTKVWDDGARVCARLSPDRPLYIGARASGIAAIVVWCLVGYGLLDDSMSNMLILWGVVLAGGAGGYLYQQGELDRGYSDLVFDDIAKTVSLPRTMGRRAVAVVPIQYIKSVEVEQTEKLDSDKRVTHRYAPVLVLADEAESTRYARLIEWSDQAAAQELAAWLRERLGIEQGRNEGCEMLR
ncbi:MAG: DUF3592 domain-containing protein [Thermoguttaceae bacterium]